LQAAALSPAHSSVRGSRVAARVAAARVSGHPVRWNASTAVSVNLMTCSSPCHRPIDDFRDAIPTGRRLLERNRRPGLCRSPSAVHESSSGPYRVETGPPFVSWQRGQAMQDGVGSRRGVHEQHSRGVTVREVPGNGGIDELLEPLRNVSRARRWAHSRDSGRPPGEVRQLRQPGSDRAVLRPHSGYMVERRPGVETTRRRGEISGCMRAAQNARPRPSSVTVAAPPGPARRARTA
jgi:hypothetical protein